ncbi:hypothetical protein B0T26DRAFT_756497 [Lasiosphaeria miniovina]|uniref:Uncharacterized protein n=1 Tax=Lasiosphaeria miniovina TaxID=1954250 RepID=A0AA40A139_9PEZI|nr:uncharacterized protein B0T26DRAFT_756497 [Lasiosphaeria miniovina]KAK0707109.1 hypothetical protein B0T26DRAFT_756497 [Lasiosphaeria miniovina]
MDLVPTPRRKRARNGPLPPGDPFIIVTEPSAKLDAASRKYIRSHVMRGKNRKRRSPHENLSLGPWIKNEKTDPDDSSLTSQTSPSPVPTRIGNDFATFPFVVDMTPYMRKLIYQWFSIIKEAMFPEKVCMPPKMAPWVEYLAYDSAYFHSILFSSQAFMDYSRESRFGPYLIVHCNNTMNSLRENLNSDRATADSTLAVVLALTLMAEVLGEREAAKKHMDGLYQLVDLRGGLKSMVKSKQLQNKICRCDIGYAMGTGNSPLFFAGGDEYDEYFSSIEPKNRIVVQSRCPSPPPHSVDEERLSSGAISLANDGKLANTWLVLEEYSRSVNMAVSLKRKLMPDVLHETIISAQYRLLALDHEGAHKHSLVESMMRVGMLAFACTTIFQIRLYPLKYKNLAGTMRHFIMLGMEEHGEDEEEKDPALLRLKLWFIFIAHVSVIIDPEDTELLVSSACRTLSDLGMASASWSVVREVLLEHMWVDYIHGEKGEALFAEVRAAPRADSVNTKGSWCRL